MLASPGKPLSQRMATARPPTLLGRCAPAFTIGAGVQFVAMHMPTEGQGNSRRGHDICGHQRGAKRAAMVRSTDQKLVQEAQHMAILAWLPEVASLIGHLSRVNQPAR
jgi:hypothetical protein